MPYLRRSTTFDKAVCDEKFIQPGQPLYAVSFARGRDDYGEFLNLYPDWIIQEEQLLLYWIYTYFCGAVYDEQIFAKVKMAVICTFMIHELAMGTWLLQQKQFSFPDLVSICYRFSRELEHSDQNLNKMEELLDWESIFSLENLLEI